MIYVFFPLENLISDIKVEIDENCLFLNKMKWKDEEKISKITSENDISQIFWTYIFALKTQIHRSRWFYGIVAFLQLMFLKKCS